MTGLYYNLPIKLYEHNTTSRLNILSVSKLRWKGFIVENTQNKRLHTQYNIYTRKKYCINKFILVSYAYDNNYYIQEKELESSSTWKSIRVIGEEEEQK